MRFFLAILAVLALGWPAAAEVIDEVVASVDTEVILRSDLESEIVMTPNASSNEAMQQALDRAIEQRILYREALLQGLELPESTVEERVDNIKKSFETNEAFEEMLAESGMTMPEFREMVRKQILAVSMGSRKRRELAEEVVISEGDIRQFYQDHQGEFAMPERVLVRRIFLAADSDEASRAKSKARLEALRDEIAAGANFADLAKQHSEGPDAAEGGLVGWVVRGDLVPELEAAAFALQPGQLSEVVSTEFGFHLLQAEDRKEAGAEDFDSLRTQIEPMLRERIADERYGKWMEELRKRSRVRIF